MDGLAVESDLALRYVALVNIEQTGNRPDCGGLARPVGAQESDDLPIRDLETDSTQHENYAVVNNLYAFDGQQPDLLQPAH